MENNQKIKKAKKSSSRILLLRYSKIATIILIIVIVLFSYYFILEPKYQQVGIGGSYNIDTLETEFEKRTNYLNDLKQLQENIRKVNQQDIAKLERILPKDEDIPGIFVELEALALKNNFLISSININEVPEPIKSEVKDKSPIKKLNISLSLVNASGGSYSDLKEFLDGLEYNLRLFDVNSVYFTPDSAYYSVSMSTYYYPN